MGKDKLSKSNMFNIVGNVIYYIILIPLVLITVTLVCETFFQPDKIPDVFGYKMFMVMNDYDIDNIDYGDLVFTKNINSQELNNNDIVAVRGKENLVTFLNSEDILIEQTIEGVFVGKIPNVGNILIQLQNPIVLVAIILIILSIGMPCYYIAQRLDEKESKKMI